MPVVFLHPIYDIIILVTCTYSIIYWIFTFYKIDVFNVKSLIIGWFIDFVNFMIIAFGLWYYWSNFPFPFWLNWFWYSLIVMIFVEFALIKLFNFKFDVKK